MNCAFCGQALSGLIAGFIALVSFIAFPIIQLMLACLRLVIDKITPSQDNFKR